MDCYIQECTALAAYIKGTVKEGKDSLVQIVAENEGEKIYGIMSYLAGLQKKRKSFRNKRLPLRGTNENEITWGLL